MNHRHGGEAVAIVEAVHIDDRARFRRRFRYRSDENTAAAADQKVARAGSKAVILYQRPIIRPDLEQAFWIGDHAGAMTAAK